MFEVWEDEQFHWRRINLRDNHDYVQIFWNLGYSKETGVLRKRTLFENVENYLLMLSLLRWRVGMKWWVNFIKGGV